VCKDGFNTVIDISIIIVNWNTKDILLTCLASVKKQHNCVTREVIVVDNGSTDGSVDAVKTNYPETIVIANNANLGFAKANNLGINRSKGRYICLVNSDVEMLDGCLSSLMTFMDENPGVGISGPKLFYPDLTTQNSCRKFPSLWNNLSPALGLNKIFRNSAFFSDEHMTYFEHDNMLFVDYLAGCVLFVRRKAAEKVGFLDERFFIYSEEVDWCKRFKQSGWHVAFFPEATAVHHHGASSSKDPLRFVLAHQKSLLQYWDKHHNRVSRMCVRLVLILKHLLRIISNAILYCVSSNNRSRITNRINTHITCLTVLLRSNNVA